MKLHKTYSPWEVRGRGELSMMISSGRYQEGREHLMWLVTAFFMLEVEIGLPQVVDGFSIPDFASFVWGTSEQHISVPELLGCVNIGTFGFVTINKVKVDSLYKAWQSWINSNSLQTCKKIIRHLQTWPSTVKSVLF